MGGWIKIYRDMLQWEWFGVPEMVQVFLYLLLNANSEDRRWQGMTVKRGQHVTSYNSMCCDLKLSRQKIRTCIQRLISTNEITIKSTNRFTVITISNYESYQDRTNCYQPTEQPTEQPTSNQQTTTPKEIKEYISTTTTTTTARARVSEEEEKKLIEEIRDSSGWCAAVARRYGFGSAEEAREKFEEFALDMQCKGRTHKDATDAKRHFNDWLRLQLKEKRKEKEKSEKENERRKKYEFERQRYEARRGNLRVTAKSGDDYKTTF